MEGLDPKGELAQATLLKTGGRANKSWVDLELSEGFPEEKSWENEGLSGAWICLEKKDLENQSDVYYYQLMGLEIKTEREAQTVALVKGIFETGAHPILVTENVFDHREVYIPLVDRHAKLDLKNREIIVKEYQEFYSLSE